MGEKFPKVLLKTLLDLNDQGYDDKPFLLDWRKNADRRMTFRNILVLHGYTLQNDGKYRNMRRNVTMSPQLARTRMTIEREDYDFVNNEPITVSPLLVIILYMLQKKSCNPLLSLAAAFVFNLNPVYITFFLLLAWMTNLNSKYRQNRSKKIVKDDIKLAKLKARKVAATNSSNTVSSMQHNHYSVLSSSSFYMEDYERSRRIKSGLLF
jgi:hypothetical protein